MKKEIGSVSETADSEDRKYVAAIDIGGTSTRVALVDQDYNLIKRVQFATKKDNPEENMKQAASIILSFEEKPEAVGICIPGILDPKTSLITISSNLPEWIGFPVTETLSSLTELPVFIENDANLAALAEAEIGEGKDHRFVQFLTISTGIGSGLVVDKKIQTGAHGCAEEVAACILWDQGPVQGSLPAGSIEAISSGTAITRRAKEAGLDVQHAGEVNELAEKGNEAAMQIMEDAKDYLSSFIAALMAISDPEIVILGGSVAMKTPGFVEDVEKRVKSKVMSVVKPYVKVHRSTLSEDSGLLGAASLAFLNA